MECLACGIAMAFWEPRGSISGCDDGSWAVRRRRGRRSLLVSPVFTPAGTPVCQSNFQCGTTVRETRMFACCRQYSNAVSHSVVCLSLSYITQVYNQANRESISTHLPNKYPSLAPLPSVFFDGDDLSRRLHGMLHPECSIAVWRAAQRQFPLCSNLRIWRSLRTRLMLLSITEVSGPLG